LGHPNIVAFDLFDILAAPDTPGNPTRNMLRYEYELSHTSNDSHPSAAGNAAVGPRLAAALIAAANHNATTPLPLPAAVKPTLDVSPNPFNPAAMIRFDLPAAASIALDVFDLRGKLVRPLEHGHRASGSHEVRWDGRDAFGENLASGVYLCRLQVDDLAVTQVMTLVK
jgi:hypothetical protein